MTAIVEHNGDILSGDCEDDAPYHCSKIFGKPEIIHLCQINMDKIGADLRSFN